ncbi:MAG: hypothetical protein U1G07_05760 [Verrucomicrobiota bacterium]
MDQRKPVGSLAISNELLEKVKEPDLIERAPRWRLRPNSHGRAAGAESAIDYEARQVFILP